MTCERLGGGEKRADFEKWNDNQKLNRSKTKRRAAEEKKNNRNRGEKRRQDEEEEEENAISGHKEKLYSC